MPTTPAAHDVAHAIAEWMRQRVAAAGSNGLVVGLSGGIDSAVVIGLATRTLPGKVAGVIMPCHSAEQDESDARLVATHFDVPIVRVDLGVTCDTLTAALRDATASLPDRHGSPTDRDLRSRLPLANVKPRLRMTTLYYVANMLGYLVAGTGNRSELSIGYYTKYGDGGVDLLPIGGLLKRQVRDVARDLGVPDPILHKAPSAGLWPGQTDEHEMGFSYDDLETYLTGGRAGLEPSIADRIQRLVEQSAHKRDLPPMPDVPV